MSLHMNIQRPYVECNALTNMRFDEKFNCFYCLREIKGMRADSGIGTPTVINAHVSIGHMDRLCNLN
jgi:hypothetical protein